MISAVVLTKNEEKNIERCLGSLLWCDEVIVIDDDSDDKTIEIIQNAKAKSQKLKLKVKIFQSHLGNDFSAQRNIGLEKTKGEWVLFVDTDEVVTKDLAKEIGEIVAKDNQTINGFYLKRQDFFEGKWLKHGETANVKLLRLARKRSGKWQGRVHEEWKITGKAADLTSPLLHYPHETLSEFLKEINYYSTIRAQELKENGSKTKFWQIIFYPKIKFLQNYFLRLGFLDGFSGLV
ncbi:glycosyltransferase family 2 protein, partial [Candidatus Gottesmanbacteria bacterium]|nr:glycosyltransferase family 2 protein [Candidatus Gottesmanbacteria bacterium]